MTSSADKWIPPKPKFFFPHLEGKKVVFTNGCFDMLHIGHVRYLEAARGYGDVLIVGVDSDESFRRCKGRNPLFPQDQRAEMLKALKCVDDVRIFEEGTLDSLIAGLKPDVLVKGEDYKPKEVLGREHAKKTVCISVGVDIHTSDLISRIRNL